MWQGAISPRRRPYAWLGLAFGLVTTLLALWLSDAGRLGDYNDCLRRMDANCYCEGVRKSAIEAALAWGRTIDVRYIETEVLIHPGVVRQPVSTWSNLAAVIFGIGVLWVLGAGLRRSTDPGLPNPMAGPTPRAIGFGLVLVFMGPGSMFLHASRTQIGGFVDNLSMNFFISFVLLHDGFRIKGWDGDAGFCLAFVLGNGVLGALVFPGMIPVEGAGLVVFGTLVTAAIGLEALLAFPEWPPFRRLQPSVRHLRRKPGWLLASLAFFTTAFAIWNLSGDGGPLCDPESLLQGHGAWHVLAYASVGCFFLHFRGETRVAQRELL